MAQKSKRKRASVVGWAIKRRNCICAVRLFKENIELIREETEKVIRVRITEILEPRRGKK